MYYGNQVFEKSSNILAANRKEIGQVLTGKLDKLSKQLSKLLVDGVIVAFSGGIDSAMLLWAAKRVKNENGGRLLADAGFTKDDIRIVLQSNHLTIAEKPASSCLSSRIVTGISITEKRLNDIEAMEAILKKADVNIFRVRLCQENTELFLRIESVPEEMQTVLYTAT